MFPALPFEFGGGFKKGLGANQFLPTGDVAHQFIYLIK